MKPDIEAHELQAFVDDALDLARRLVVEERVANDPAIRRKVDELRQLRTMVREQASYHTAPESLRRQLAGLGIGDQPRLESTKPRRFAGRTGSWSWRPMATAFTVVIAASLGLQVWVARSGDEAKLRDDVVASHVRSTIGDRLVDVPSSDHHTVKPWLSSKLDYSPPVRDAQLGDATFVGGRVDYLDGRPVAALVYRKGAHVVDTYVWPTTSSDATVAYAFERGYQLAHWTRGGMTYWAISDVNRAEFGDFIGTLSTTEAAR